MDLAAEVATAAWRGLEPVVGRQRGSVASDQVAQVVERYWLNCPAVKRASVQTT